MPRRTDRMRHSMAHWIVRFGLAMTTMVIGYISVSHSIGYASRARNAERAHQLAPWDGRVTAALAQRLLTPDASNTTRERIDRIARKALRQDSTAVGAASTWALNEELRGDVTAARRMIAYAERVSRRDLPTQLWTIEYAVNRGDVAGALNHYDIALRTSRNAADILFPVLAGAIADPAIRNALIGTLAKQPSWSSLFVEYLAANGPDPRSTAHLFAGLQRADVPISDISQMLLIDALTSRRMFSDAWAYYAVVHRGANRRQIRNPSFSDNPTQPTQFDWRPIGTDGVTASLQQQGTKGLLDFSARSGAGGAAIQQAQLLPPGRYQLRGHSTGLQQEDDARPYWTLACPSGRELGRVDVPNSSNANGLFSGMLNVPVDCPVQMLTLIIKASDNIQGVSGRIDEIRLEPA